MRQTLSGIARHLNGRARLSLLALAEPARARSLMSRPDPGAEPVLREVIGWLGRAQDRSATRDGGVARDYSLVRGWAASYPETTGYIVPTLIEYARRSGDARPLDRARRMADWLVAIQLSSGGFQGGKIDSRPIVPVTFNTGQILLGLAAAERRFGGYLDPMRRAADWLVATQDPDGGWRRHPTPFAKPGDKAYETHVAWGLFEAARIDPARGYAEAAMANVRWALGLQRDNGWFDHCCLDDNDQPLSHTIGYTLRGLVEAYRFGQDRSVLDAARRTADALLRTLDARGRIPGCLRADWSAAVSWTCLTGNVQIAACWLDLFTFTRETRYAEAALAANAFVRRTVRCDGPADVRGGVRGSWPSRGAYGRYMYLNWAAKFLADSLMLEIDLRPELSATASGARAS